MGLIIQDDCLNYLPKITNRSVQLICIDPPYNINKEDWDNWGRVEKGYIQKEKDKTNIYYEWLGNIFTEFERILKDNGTFIFFHNDFRMMSQLDLQIQKKTKLKYKNFIIWNKLFIGSKNEGFLNGYVKIKSLRNFQKMAEYFLIYVKDNTWKLKEAKDRLKIRTKDISKEVLSKTGGMTGWYNNIETGKNYPTEKTIVPITKYLDLTIDDIVPKFRNQKTHHSVWNYEMVKNKNGHLTEKPVDLLKNILLHFTDEHDMILDCFAGSGSLGIACMELNRDFILIEKEKRYVEIIKRRLK